MSIPGRNDPCHCGSGKKYKKCHWRDDQARATERAQLERARAERLEALGQPTDSEMRKMYEESTGGSLSAGPITADTRQMLTDLWRQERLAEQARETLEPELERWKSHFEDNPEEFDAVARELAGHPALDDYTLTVQNIAKVRSELGPLPEEGEERTGYATEATRISLDAKDRTYFRQGLLSLLPELVDEGRLKEAYVLVNSAQSVLDPEAPLSPFLEAVVTRSLQ
jgi:hypothetical protein